MYFEIHCFIGCFHSSVALTVRNYVPHSSMIAAITTIASKRDAAEGQTCCSSFCLPESFRCMKKQVGSLLERWMLSLHSLLP